ncbi:MAG: GntR family transcriptional regulator [Ilumatobacteraceae bacterium]|nr:GntR family transcriptional regulator [Ilumatobacteraceae bacterium]
MVDALGGWTTGSGPLYRLLARAVTAAVERGDLDRGARLPSERSLAAAVDVSRGVVVAAYDELVADGTIERRQGSGTFVAGSPEVGLPPGREGSALFGRLVEGRTDAVIDLSISVLHEARWLPDVTVRAADVADPAADSPWGIPALRERVARGLSAVGLPTGAEQVVITTGAQQGISIAAGCWVRPGDAVVVDDPTYPGVLSALAAAGAVVRPVPVDRDGIVLAEMEAALADRPALVYLQTGPHSPTGTHLSRHRRAVIARWLVERRVPLIEDVALESVDWSATPPLRPLAAHIPDHPAAVVGSFSKQFWAGLRVGFVRAPGPVAARLVRVKATHDLGSSTVSQAMALALLEHPGHSRALARRNRVLARRADLLVALLAEALPDWRCSAPDGGLSLWVQLPGPVAARFADAALRHGVAVATADGLSVTGRHRDRLRLTFALPEPDLREAVARLATAWNGADVSAPGRRRPLAGR